MRRLIRVHEVAASCGVSRSTIYRLMSRCDFPKPAKIGQRTIAWAEDEIEAWVETRMKEREA